MVTSRSVEPSASPAGSRPAGTSSSNFYRSYPSPAWATRRNPDRLTFGPAVGALARFFGLPLMGWQQYVADVGLEVNADGLFVYKIVDIAVPRQSGKTTLFGFVMDHRALTVRLGRVWFTMQNAKDAVDWLLNEHVPVIEGVGAEATFRRAQGSEAIRWKRSGGTVRTFAPQPKNLHGKHTDLVVVDEAWS